MGPPSVGHVRPNPASDAQASGARHACGDRRSARVWTASVGTVAGVGDAHRGRRWADAADAEVAAIADTNSGQSGRNGLTTYARAGVWRNLSCSGARLRSVRLCPAISDASSMRGGRSTRASHQSRLRSANTARGGCKANRPAARSAPSMACATGTRRQSRQPEPTQVSGLIAAQLRAWSCEIAAKRGYVRLGMDPTSDDQQRSSRIRPVVRRRSRITRKTASFGRIHGSSKSGVAATNGGL